MNPFAFLPAGRDSGEVWKQVVKDLRRMGHQPLAIRLIGLRKWKQLFNNYIYLQTHVHEVEGTSDGEHVNGYESRSSFNGSPLAQSQDTAFAELVERRDFKCPEDTRSCLGTAEMMGAVCVLTGFVLLILVTIWLATVLIHK